MTLMIDGSSLTIDRRNAVIALIIVNVLWGSSFPIMKCLNLQVDQHFGVSETTASASLRTASAAWMIAIRFGLAFLLFCLFFGDVVRRVGAAHFWSGVAIGATFFVGLLLQVIGLATIPASRSGFLTSLTVVFTPLIATILRRRLPRIPVLAAAGVALTGVAVLTGMLVIDKDGVSLAEDAIHGWSPGDAVTIAGAVVFSVQILLIDRLGRRYDAVAFTPSMFATTTMLACIVFTWLHGIGILPARIDETVILRDATPTPWITLAVHPPFLLLIGLLCVFPSLLAFKWMNEYQPVVSAGQAAVIYTLEPVFASLWAMCLPALLSMLCAVSYSNERLSVPLVVGGCLVLLANALALWPEASKKRK